MAGTDKYNECVTLLKENRNLILTGAPGTGKTYLARKIAEIMGAEYEFVQFHPSYDYTDFVEGLRPTLPDNNGNIGFERKDGVFKEFCKRAEKTRPLKENFYRETSINEMRTKGDYVIPQGASFHTLYDILKKRIQDKSVTLYTVYPRTTMDVCIMGNDIMYNKGGRYSSNYINSDYVQKIYNYYKNKGVYDIKRESFQDFVSIIGNTLNYTYYRGIVQELLDMSIQENSTLKSTIDYQHKDILPLLNSNSEEEIPINQDVLVDSEMLSDDEVEKCLKWLIDTQNGKIIQSLRSPTQYELVIKNGEIYVRIPKGTINYVSPNGIKQYLKTHEYDVKHQTYEPSIGQYILDNCPLIKNILSFSNSNLEEKKVLCTSSIEEKDTGNNPFIFIIDEINRGEISKIFGELFFCIDPGYRGEKGKVKTQYQNLITDPNDPFIDGFYIPDNVYIIGTMNDIDRSVESMDFAMRRRFAWKEIKADENTGMLDDLGALKAEVIEKMNRLNNAIWNEEPHEGIDGLNAAYHIGGAYFRKLKHYLHEDFSNKEEAYHRLWNNHLRGLLFEYLRGSADAAENMKRLEEVYFCNGIND